MYRIFISLAAALLIAMQDSPAPRPALNAAQQVLLKKKMQAVLCTPDLSTVNLDGIPALPGWGTHRFNVSTVSDSALWYFNQGINMYYGFHIIESMASFKKAALLDSNFAMAYWGQALALGPNINDLLYTEQPDAYKTIQRAKQLMGNLTEPEKLLIEAQSIRYSPDSTANREELNKKYAAAMKDVAQKLPDHAEAGTLYADALMLLHPWDLYDKDGQPKSWTPEIVAVLESNLKKFPNHPGANHYYIHAVEASTSPQRALKSADLLGTLTPGISHLVHMPSHIYIRTGDFQKGQEVNIQAVAAYKTYQDKFPEVVNNIFLYVIHNVHMQAVCSQMQGLSKATLKASYETRNSFDSSYNSFEAPLGPGLQYIYSTPEMSMVRYGMWDSIKAIPRPKASWLYADFLWNFSRAMAEARTGNLSEARTYLLEMQKLNKHPDLAIPLGTFNAPAAAGNVAIEIVKGVIAEEEGKMDVAIQAFETAVTHEDKLIYNEPRDWTLPARHYLGRVLIKAKKFEDAKKVYLKDLEINPKNSWSVWGLKQVAEAKKQKTEVTKLAKLFQEYFGQQDISIAYSAF